jgi:uncharacterized protein YjbI with pentapeptide repeats
VPHWEPEGLYETERYVGFTARDVLAAGARFVDCTVASVTLEGADLARTAWRGTRLQAVRLVSAGLARSQWQDAEFDGCALAGCEWYGATLRGVTLRDCALDSVNLRGATLSDVGFEGCVLRDLDLGGARLTAVRFPQCRIERLDLTQATLDGVDLRGAVVGIARGFDRLGGAIVDPGQLIDLAPALAAHIGLHVRPIGDP